MSCVLPCQTCTSPNFYSCLSCADSTLTLASNTCIQQPYTFLQITTTCLYAIFLMAPLFRKRAMVLTRILDIIQITACFKYVVHYSFYRHHYLYMAMRSWSPWTQGWGLITVSGDLQIPIFSFQETAINKLIRIGAIWVAFLTALLIIGLTKSLLSDTSVRMNVFFWKNIGNACSICFNATCIDLGLFIGQVLFSTNWFSSTLSIILFVVAILLALACFLMMVWMFWVVNSVSNDTNYNSQFMFLFCMDYDFFTTYTLLDLPTRTKTIQRYSNLRFIQIAKKLWCAFLVMYYLNHPSLDPTEEIFQLLGIYLFCTALFYLIHPFSLPQEFLQISISITSDLLFIAVLFFPLLLNSSTYQLIHLIIINSLFALALLSLIAEMFLEIYRIIPIDLYETGIKIIIEDLELKKLLEQREKQIRNNSQQMRRIIEENMVLQSELRKNKTGKVAPEVIANIFEQSLGDNTQQKEEDVQSNNLLYPDDDAAMPTDDISRYKIDPKKKRRVYQWNKKAEFVYSNKVEE